MFTSWILVLLIPLFSAESWSMNRPRLERLIYDALGGSTSEEIHAALGRIASTYPNELTASDLSFVQSHLAF
jgi:hypothetical protein